MRLAIVKHEADAEPSGFTERTRNGYGDKMRHFNKFFASFLRFCVFDLCFFCNGCNVVLTSYTAISIKESH